MGIQNLEFNRIEYLGILAGSFAVASGILQVYKIYQNKSAEDISLWALIGAIISTGIWIYYHYTKKGGGPFITTTATMLFLLTALFLKIYYDIYYNSINDSSDPDAKSATPT